MNPKRHAIALRKEREGVAEDAARKMDDSQEKERREEACRQALGQGLPAKCGDTRPGVWAFAAVQGREKDRKPRYYRPLFEASYVSESKVSPPIIVFPLQKALFRSVSDRRAS